MPSDPHRAHPPTLPAAIPEPYAPRVQFHVLGPVEALKDGVPVRLGGPKQRTVLALLLAEAGRRVSVDRLIDLVWGDEPTPGARSTLHTYISNLRGELGETLVRDGGGYRLQVERADVDAFRFEDEVTRGRELMDGRPVEAAQRLRDALALWRGHPFADISGSALLDQEARRLEELRLGAIEDRIEAELALGNHVGVVGELEVLAAEHPLRERLRALHMLALYRSDRQAEALHAYQKTRTFLAEEMGIDPSPALRELEGKILRQDPSLGVGSEPRVETLVFLLTDIEDSTVLWELHPRAMGAAAARYDGIVAEAVVAAGGRVAKRVGDGLDAVFTDVGSAVTAAGEAQRALFAADWGETGPLKARMAIDVGDVEARGSDYFGPVLNRCGRILAAGHGGQVLLSADAHAALSESEAGWQARALGEFRLKGLGRPQPVFQLLVEGLPSEFPPLRIDRPPPSPRTTFDRTVRGYELREQVGGGEFGVVYRAYQPSVGREVAVKVIRPEFVNHPTFVRRFEAEAQLVAGLEHPHIVALYDYWRDPDGAYLVMRWLRGGSLREALDRGPWNPEPASRLLQQVGSALAYAHRQGVVHRDLKPGNVLLDAEGNAYLSDFGVAARMVDASEAGRPLTSSPAYVPPEELRGESLRAASDIFALGVLTFELLSGRRAPLDRSLPAITRLRPDLPQGIDAVIARATADDPGTRFASVEEFLEAFLGALGQTPSAEEVGLTPTRNPYKGLRAFSEVDAHDFYGRDGVIDELVQAVEGHRLVAVVGPSGIGKSSVVRAGLLPALRAGGLPGSGQWVITDMFPGPYPFEELEGALLRVAVECPEGLTEDLARDARGLLRVTKRILPSQTEALLVIDQFEELFTLTSDEDVRRLFLDSLATVVTDGRSRLRVVVTLRADFFDRPLRYPRFGELLREGMVAVTAPGEADLAEAITRPAQTVGVRFEPGLVPRIIGDVNHQPGALPLLQYALTELFASRTSDLLTIHGYQASGRVLGALGRRAEELYQSLDAPGKEATRQVFLRLVAVSETAEDTRRRVRRRELHGLGVEPEVLEEVLRRFGEYRLLSFDRDPLTRGPTVEVAHEALLSEWGRLGQWISERREDLLLQRRLADAIAEWEQAGTDRSYLLAGGRLGQFAAWADRTDLALTAQEREYLQKSREADAQSRSRKRRRLRSLVAALAVVALVSSGLTVFAFDQRGHATREARIAFARELTAAAVANLDLNPQLSLLLALQAVETTYEADGTVIREAEEMLHRVVQAVRIQTLAGTSGVVFTSDFRMASVRRNPRSGGAVAVVDLTRGRQLFAHSVGDFPLAVAFSPDERLLALSSSSGAVTVWDSTNGAERFSLPGGTDFDGLGLGMGAADAKPCSERAARVEGGGCPSKRPLGRLELGGLALSPDGRVLAVRFGQVATVWDLVGGRELFPLTGHGDGVSLAFTPDGSRLVSTEFGWGNRPLGDPVPRFTLKAKIWEVSSGTELRSLSWEAGTFPGGDPPQLASAGPPQLAFSPDGNQLAIGGLKVTVGDLATGRVRFTRRVSSTDFGRVTDLEFSPDGSRLATASSDGQATIWDGRSGERLFTLSGHDGLINDLAFSPDGTRLVTGGGDGARLWDPTSGRQLLTLVSDLPLIGVSFNPNGSRLATVDGPRIAGQMSGGVARVYLLRIEDLIGLARDRLTRGFTEEECRTYLHLDRCPARSP